LDVHTGVNVERLDRTDAGWTLTTNQGQIDAWAVVIAAGYNRVANVPSWPGLEGFTGELVNAPDYRSARPFEGKSVLVVGAGNTGAEICVDLNEKGAAKVWWAVRTPPNIVLRDGPIPPPLMGVVLKFLRVPNRIGDAFTTWGQKQDIGDLTPYGLEPSPRGMFTAIRVDQIAPIIDVGTIECLKAGKIHVTKAVERVEGSEVVFADGERVARAERPAAQIRRRNHRWSSPTPLCWLQE
jgi:putative flavoprotein involved in K+ transport